jgi:paraquat-inducible protein B
VLAELNQNMVADAAGHLIKLTDRATLQRLIDQGLRAKIDLVGITGLQFVELDFFDPQQFPAPPAASDAEYPVVPTLRSGMSELVENLSKIAGNLNKVDFAGLSKELKSLLATVNQQAGGLDLKKMVAAVTSAAASIEALAGSAEAKRRLRTSTKPRRTCRDWSPNSTRKWSPSAPNSCGHFIPSTTRRKVFKHSSARKAAWAMKPPRHCAN